MSVPGAGQDDVQQLGAGRVRLSFGALELVASEEQDRGVGFPALGLLEVHDLDPGLPGCPCPDQRFVACAEKLLRGRSSVDAALAGVTEGDARAAGA
ncbi:hypothetical protein [Streptomyces sp. NPDC047042]|uniref:hypothetical protein n=1 Tax=Streptomyces sp. NPDC047042 TaxID=3154807 RepID=UPI003401F53A